ncbi:MAG TPA: hypothetical protein VF037_08100 [Gemmatimonadales bacterium]
MTAGARLKVAGIVALLAGCSRGSPLESPERHRDGRVEIMLGAVTDADGNVSLPRTVFAPSDTIRIRLGGLPDADTVVVRWVRADGDDPGTVADSTVGIPAAGQSALTLSVTPGRGWDPGAYAADVSVGGRPAGSVPFEVR